MQYICEPDLERRAAGWGEHWWIIDTEQEGPKRLLFLMPEREAKQWADKMNGIRSPPAVSRTRKFLDRIFGSSRRPAD
jgi:hypothetical protein